MAHVTISQEEYDRLKAVEREHNAKKRVHESLEDLKHGRIKRLA